MQRRIGVLLLIVAWSGLGCSGEHDRAAPEDTSSPGGENIGAPLYEVSAAAALPSAVPPRSLRADPVVIGDCRLSVIEKQEVPSQREGVLLAIGTEVGPEEEVPADRLLTLTLHGETRRYRRLQEDDRVEAGQLLAQLDDRLAHDDLAIKNAKVVAAKADLTAAEKTRDEARQRFLTLEKLNHQGSAATTEEVRASKLTWERYTYECDSKREAQRLAERERSQAETVLTMHQIRSSIPGVVKAIYKKRGESVKNLEPVFQIVDLSHLRAEGMIEVEYLPRLRKGMTVAVEPTVPEAPLQTLLGHLQEVTAVAVSGGKEPWIVSAGEDGTVRVWQPGHSHEHRVLDHPAAVRCVACAPIVGVRRWCLSGAADGSARLWDLSAEAETPVHVWAGAHKGVVTCAAFSPDGEWCATGGDDRDVCLWEVATGTLRYRLPSGHRAALTMLHFTPQAQLVSAGRDNTVRVWCLGAQAARLESTLDRRSGDLVWPGVSPDGRHLLLDQGKALRLLSLKDRRTECVLENAAEASQFSTFALFSPDARLLLTAGAAEGRLQLWCCPTVATRAHELRRLVTREPGTPTCAAFAPDSSFVVTGSQERQVLIWPVPAAAEQARPRTARVTLVEPAVDSSARQVRLWAEVANLDGRLLPGTTVTLTVYSAVP